jgi:glutamine phosphoribosylpyrophosphate amidotransferase
MEKKITAMQELIERLKGLQNRGHDDAGIRTAIDIATELLPKEKKQIADAFMEGYTDHHRKEDLYENGSHYFNQNYNDGK